MRPMLVIGNKNYSSWSLRPWLAARHAGIEFDEIRVSLFTPEGTAQIQQHSPSLKVPVWREGELVVWESLAICEYLAERVPSLWPADAAARAVARSVSAEMHAGFAALRHGMPMNARARGRRARCGKICSPLSPDHPMPLPPAPSTTPRARPRRAPAAAGA